MPRRVADGPTAEVLGDRDVRRRAGLTLPPLLTWLLGRSGVPAAAQRVLHRLDTAVAEPAALGVRT